MANVFDLVMQAAIADMYEAQARLQDLQHQPGGDVLWVYKFLNAALRQRNQSLSDDDMSKCVICITRPPISATVQTLLVKNRDTNPQECGFDLIFKYGTSSLIRIIMSAFDDPYKKAVAEMIPTRFADDWKRALLWDRCANDPSGGVLYTNAIGLMSSSSFISPAKIFLLSNMPTAEATFIDPSTGDTLLGRLIKAHLIGASGAVDALVTAGVDPLHRNNKGQSAHELYIEAAGNWKMPNVAKAIWEAEVNEGTDRPQERFSLIPNISLAAAIEEDDDNSIARINGRCDQTFRSQIMRMKGWDASKVPWLERYLRYKMMLPRTDPLSALPMRLIRYFEGHPNLADLFLSVATNGGIDMPLRVLWQYAGYQPQIVDSVIRLNDYLLQDATPIMIQGVAELDPELMFTLEGYPDGLFGLFEDLTHLPSAAAELKLWMLDYITPAMINKIDSNGLLPIHLAACLDIGAAFGKLTPEVCIRILTRLLKESPRTLYSPQILLGDAGRETLLTPLRFRRNNQLRSLDGSRFSSEEGRYEDTGLIHYHDGQDAVENFLLTQMTDNERHNNTEFQQSDNSQQYEHYLHEQRRMQLEQWAREEQQMAHELSLDRPTREGLRAADHGLESVMDGS